MPAASRGLVVPRSALNGLQFCPYQSKSPFESYKPLQLPFWAASLFHVVRILNLFVIGTGLGFCVVAFLLFGHAETNPIGLSFGTAFILLIAGFIVSAAAFLLGPTICGTSNLIRLGHQEGFFLTCYMIFLAVLSTESFTVCHLYLSRQLPRVLQDDLDATLSGWNTATLTTASVFLVIIPLISMALSLVHKIKVYFLQLQDTLVISHLSWSHAAANHRAKNIRKFQPHADPEFAASLDFDSDDEVDEIIEKYFLKTDIDENPTTEVSEWLDAAQKYTKTKSQREKDTASTSSRAAVVPEPDLATATPTLPRTPTTKPAPTPAPAPEPQLVSCLRCTFANPPGSITCEMCASPLSVQSPNPTHSTASDTPSSKAPSREDRPSIDVKMVEESISGDVAITPENFLLSLPEDIRRELNQRHFTFDDSLPLSEAPTQTPESSPPQELADADSSSITDGPHDEPVYQTEAKVQPEPPVAPPPQQHAAGKCIYCNTRKVSIIILPCRHLCLCSECATEVGVTDCPVCQTPVQYVSEVFY